MIGVAVALAAAAQPAPPARMTAAEVAQVQAALDIGATIYLYDQAAWVATDQLVADIPNPEAKGVRGWIVEGNQDRRRVIFYGLEGERPVAIYEADVDAQQKVVSHGPAGKPDLTAIEEAMVRARQVALRSQTTGCVERPFNPVVIPPRSAADPVPVYLLTPQVETGVYPFGGHYRVTVAADGKVLEKREFTRTCIALDTRDGQHPEGLFITHLLDPVPTPIHVWLSLWSRLPVYVSTPGQEAWAVEGARIRLLARDLKEKPAPAR
jgi:hypothetical protein